jgi:hypothetical protein
MNGRQHRQDDSIDFEGKKSYIKKAALGPGSPGWDDILDLTWEEIVEAAKQRRPGFQTIKKLLSKEEYDK